MAGCFASVLFLMSCGCWHSVALPRGALGRSVVCDCGNSWSSLLSEVRVMLFLNLFLYSL